MDGLHNLFEQFRAGGMKYIRRTVNEQWPETLLLDFKRAANNTGPMHPDDRKTLAEALSGFANSEGGIIIWGVRADRTAPDEPDVARELKPISKLDVFISDLWTYTPQVVSPPIIHVNHIPIYQSKTKKIGYAITFVPKSEGDPHMSMAKGDRCYFCRSAASFIKMEHYMVADRFRRKAHPKLEFVWRLEEGEGNYSDHNRQFGVEVVVGIRNVGTGIALYPGLGVDTGGRFQVALHGLDGNGKNGLPKLPLAHDRTDRHFNLFAGGMDHAIYPGTTIEVARLQTRIACQAAVCPDVEMKYELYCDGFADVSSVYISGDDLLRFRGF